jgi:hypothetical protein
MEATVHSEQERKEPAKLHESNDPRRHNEQAHEPSYSAGRV